LGDGQHIIIITIIITTIIIMIVNIMMIVYIPVVPRKAAAEVSKFRKPMGEVGCCESWMAERIH